MKSNICVVEKGGLGLENILWEVEKVTKYNEMPEKEALRLRLLAEELVGMLPTLVNDFEGTFWLQNIDKEYELHAEIAVGKLSKEKKESLIAISANKKNAAATSFMGKIRDVAQNMLLFSETPSDSDYLYDYHTSDVHYTYAWTLDYYKKQQMERLPSDSDEWDELERSIVAKLADDVIVGVRGKKVEIIIKKKF